MRRNIILLFCVAQVSIPWNITSVGPNTAGFEVVPRVKMYASQTSYTSQQTEVAIQMGSNETGHGL